MTSEPQPNPRPRAKPEWWPENEPWPPRNMPLGWRSGWDRGNPWRGNPWEGSGRWRGMRRWGWLWALAGLTMVLLACIGGTALFWLIASGVGSVASPLGAFGRLLSGAVFIVGMLGLIFVVRMFRATARPIGDLMDAAARVEAGDFSARVRVRGPREVRQLTSAFNAMAERLQANEDARRNLLADVTHELRTPLTIIQGNLEGVLDGIYPRDDAHLAPILEESRVMARLIEDLRTLSLAESGALTLQREPADLSALAHDVATAFQGQADAAGVTLSVSAHEPLMADIDKIRIRAVLHNLIANALRYAPSGGSVTVSVARDGDKARVEVSDTGRGIPPDALPHVFDRFFKGRDSLGTGLGLAIAKQLVQAHGGEIHAESEMGRGTKITITLPLEAHS